MATTYTPFRQGNGVESWIVEETDGEGTLTSKYMVYEDPYKKQSIREIERLSPEEIATFKGLIGVTEGGRGGGGVHQLTKPISNVRYSSRLNAGGVYSTSAGPPNEIRLAPFIPANSITIKNLIGRVNGGVTNGLFRLLVYSDLNGVPSSKLIETTDLNGNTYGDSTYIVSFTFTAGTTYWLGAYTNLTGINIAIYSDAQSVSLGAESGFRDYLSRVITATYSKAPATLGATTLSVSNPYSINFTAV
jgi:hypothetical protein